MHLASDLGSKSLSISVVLLPLFPLLHDCAHRHGTVSASSSSKSTEEHLPQASDGNLATGWDDGSRREGGHCYQFYLKQFSILSGIRRGFSLSPSSISGIRSRSKFDLPAAAFPMTN
jgi:hypothetical protein